MILNLSSVAEDQPTACKLIACLYRHYQNGRLNVKDLKQMFTSPV